MRTFESWTDTPSSCMWRFRYRDGSDTSEDPDALDNLHPTELRRVRNVWVTIEPNRRRALDFDAGWSDKLRSEVTIEMSRSFFAEALELSVRAEGAAEAVGLRAELEKTLGRSATRVGLPSWIAFQLAWLIPVGFAIAGPLVARALGYGARDDRVEGAEIAGLVIGVCLGLILVAGARWTFPTLELLEDGQRSRFRRFRGWALGAAFALALGIAGSFVYGAVAD